MEKKKVKVNLAIFFLEQRKKEIFHEKKRKEKETKEMSQREEREYIKPRYRNPNQNYQQNQNYQRSQNYQNNGRQENHRQNYNNYQNNNNYNNYNNFNNRNNFAPQQRNGSNSNYQRNGNYGNNHPRGDQVIITNEMEKKVDKIFQKDYIFTAKFSLPPSNEFWKTDLKSFPPNQSLLDAKNLLNETKDKLDNLDTNIWHKHTRFNLLVDWIVSEVRNRYEPEMCTFAWLKNYELIHAYQLISQVNF